MNKLVLKLVSFFVVIGLLVGCGSGDGSDSEASSNNQSTETNNEVKDEEKQETVVITITKDKQSENIAEKEIPIEEGAILIDVMEENFDIETDYDGGFITSIDGVAPKEGEQKGWMFFVNGKMANVGVKKFELSPGDQVNFDLQAWE